MSTNDKRCALSYGQRQETQGRANVEMVFRDVFVCSERDRHDCQACDKLLVTKRE